MGNIRRSGRPKAFILAPCAALMIVTALVLASPRVALAAPCSGFGDVDAADTFCPHVDWLRNRSITLGCTPSEYCPAATVVRLSMAAFMHRLGVALTPVPIRARRDDLFGLDIDAAPVVCVGDEFLANGYPRRALVDAALGLRPNGALNFAADLVASTDGGATWAPLNTVVNRGYAAINVRTTIADVGMTELEVGQSIRWGIRLSRGGIDGTADILDARCDLRVLIYSRDGVAAPY